MRALSTRGIEMPASPIRRLVPYADQAKARGVKVHHLNIGQPDVATPPEMLRAYQGFDAKVLEYGPSAGLPALRSAVAEYYQGWDLAVAEHQVHVTTGGSEALIFAIGAVADPGDEIVVFEPFYANYNGFARLLGVDLRPVLTGFEQGFHLPSDEVIEASINDRTRALLFCSPGNPTGTVYTAEEMARIGRLAEKHDLFIISDEVYREFAYDGGKVTSALSLPCAAERVIVVDSISKRFSACGARIGFVLSQNADLESAFMRFGFARLCPATVDQMAALAAYKLPPTYFEPVISEYEARRNALVDGLNAIEGIRTYRPEGAFYTVATFPVEDADDFCTWLLTSFDHQKTTVMMAPASGFYATAGQGKQEARIAYVLNVEALEESVQVLRAAIEQYPGRR
jgi:aspartate aminotransferase